MLPYHLPVLNPTRKDAALHTSKGTAYMHVIVM